MYKLSCKKASGKTTIFRDVSWKPEKTLWLLDCKGKYNLLRKFKFLLTILEKQISIIKPSENILKLFNLHHPSLTVLTLVLHSSPNRFEQLVPLVEVPWRACCSSRSYQVLVGLIFQRVNNREEKISRKKLIKSRLSGLHPDCRSRTRNLAFLVPSGSSKFHRNQDQMLQSWCR